MFSPILIFLLHVSHHVLSTNHKPRKLTGSVYRGCKFSTQSVARTALIGQYLAVMDDSHRNVLKNFE